MEDVEKLITETNLESVSLTRRFKILTLLSEEYDELNAVYSNIKEK